MARQRSLLRITVETDALYVLGTVLKVDTSVTTGRYTQTVAVTDQPSGVVIENNGATVAPFTATIECGVGTIAQCRSNGATILNPGDKVGALAGGQIAKIAYTFPTPTQLKNIVGEVVTLAPATANAYVDVRLQLYMVSVA